jgi:hypothetical protein
VSPTFQDIVIERGVEASNGRALALAVTMDNMAATPRARVLVREQSR